MGPRGSAAFQPLPGSDALKTTHVFHPNRPLPLRAMRPFLDGHHEKYLQHPVYDYYLDMQKGVVDEEGARELLDIGQVLERQELPRYLDAAGWAYAEAGLAMDTVSAVERIECVARAETIWRRSLVNSMFLSEQPGANKEREVNEGYRTALNLAYAPLIKSVVVGNVSEAILQQALRDTIEIAKVSACSLDEACHEGEDRSADFHRGFLFEAIALMALLYLNDPRYVPLPSTARGDTGYYHREQTHDISLINQHWGEIRKVIPVEIKSKASNRDKHRYQALIISGRMRLSINGVEPRDTVDAFSAVMSGDATTQQMIAVEQISTQLREMLRLYQQGVTPEGLAAGGLTRFHDADAAAKQYPELARTPRPVGPKR